jgi:hypothetical protein
MSNRPQVVPSDPEKALMWRIYNVYHTTLADFASRTSVPEAFLAALIANESGGRPERSRWERGVFVELAEVLLTVRAKYGSLGATDLLPYVDPAAALETQPSKIVNFQVMLQHLADLATSWGVTQIMGYHAIEFKNTFGKHSSVQDQIDMTVKLLAQFAQHYQLDLRNDFEEMFSCWNTGGTDPSKTTDPQYVPNGLARMRLYSELLNENVT